MNAVLQVAGMTCQGCVAAVTRALAAVPGVQSAQVSLERGEAIVAYDPRGANPAALKAAIEAAGYEVRPAA